MTQPQCRSARLVCARRRNLRADILDLSPGQYVAPRRVDLCLLIAVLISLQLVSLICAATKV
jgi:hypothetical protein